MAKSSTQIRPHGGEGLGGEPANPYLMSPVPRRRGAPGAALAIAFLVALSLVPSPSLAAANQSMRKAKECSTQLLGATPIGVGPCDGVRPGGYHETKIGGCTWNFLFKGSDGHKYMGTAGHCLVSKGEKIWKRGEGSKVEGLIEGGQERVGEAAYADNSGIRDFGLVRLDRGVPTSPTMCHFGGPTSGAIDPATGTLLEHYGNGLVYGDTIPARTSVANGQGDKWTVYSAGAALFGDSGSAVITEDGHAVGALVHLGAFGVGISRLGPHVC